jgi:UDP-2,3-diacylglucosamine hydrolase
MKTTNHDTVPGPKTRPAPVYFLGDAHLGIESETTERSKADDLVALLGTLRGRAGHLYLMGDVFDFWFEYPAQEPSQHREVLSALSLLSASGTSIRFLGGNHDYWAGSKLEASTGATVHHEPLVVTHFGRRLFIAHGDGLPRGDRGYRILKAVIRSRPAVACFRLVPPSVGAAIARWASGLSEVSEERIARALPPMREFICEKLGTGFDGVVVGHVHRQLVLESARGTGVIVGDWMTNRSVVELGPQGFRALRWSGGALVDAAGVAGNAAR